MRAREFITEAYNLTEGARIAHAEDLIFYEGSAGALRAIANIEQLGKSRDTLSIKWDGKPALVFGRDENGQFIMTDKSGFSAKGYNGRVTSPKALSDMILGRTVRGNPDPEGRKAYVASLVNVWPLMEQAVPQNFRGFVLGDLMYSQTPPLKGNKYVFTPNTVTYEVDANSELGKRVGQSKAGIAVHTFFESPEAEGQPLTSTAGLDTTGPMMVFGPEIKTEAPLQLNKNKFREIKSYVKQNAKVIDSLLDESVLAAKKMSGFPDVLYTFVNAMTKTGDLSGIAQKFVNWVSTNPKISKPMAAKIVEHVKEHEVGFNTLFAVFEHIIAVKLDIINQLDQYDGPVTAHIAGQRGGEGYVSTDPGGNIKMVNRMGFSQANFAGNG